MYHLCVPPVILSVKQYRGWSGVKVTEYLPVARERIEYVAHDIQRRTLVSLCFLPEDRIVEHVKLGCDKVAT